MDEAILRLRYQTFRRLLIATRKRAGLTQIDLANKLGKTQSFVSKFERGERRLDLIEFLEIARILKIDIGLFLKKLDGGDKTNDQR